MTDASLPAARAPIVPSAGRIEVRRARRESVWARFRRQPPALAGLGLLGLLCLVAIFAGLLIPSDPLRPSGPPLQPPSSRHWLGTDDLGRDVLVGVVFGSRLSLAVGVVVALTSGLVGALVGSAAGYFGRLADDVLMRLTEMVQIVPRFFLLLIVAALFGPSIVALMLLLGLTFWPQTARLLRAQILALRGRDFVLAARALGAAERRVLARHVLPNALHVIVVSTALQLGSAILVEAGLSFLGLGDRTVVSWGNMLNNAQPLLRIAWWAAAFPGLAITLTVVAANLVADGLNTALDPRQGRGYRS